MARIVWACWDGGGNLPPSLEIAHALTKRGHDVRFVGRPEMVGRAASAGVTATAFRHARTDLDRYSFHPKPALFGYTSSPAVGEELTGIVEAERPDLVVIDAVIATALNVVPQFGRRELSQSFGPGDGASLAADSIEKDLHLLRQSPNP